MNAEKQEVNASTWLSFAILSLEYQRINADIAYGRVYMGERQMCVLRFGKRWLHYGRAQKVSDWVKDARFVRAYLTSTQR